MPAPRLVRGRLDVGVMSRGAAMAAKPAPAVVFALFALAGPLALVGRIATTALRHDEPGARTPAADHTTGALRNRLLVPSNATPAPIVVGLSLHVAERVQS